MIAVLKPGVSKDQCMKLIEWFEEQGVKVHVSDGEFQTVLGLIGDTTRIDGELIESLDIVDCVKRISEPFKKANRKFHPDDTIVDVGGVKIGGGHMAMIAGPSAIESREQILAIASEVKAAGAQILRASAFSPRTSPYDFQGLHEQGIELLIEAKEKTGLPVVTEIMNAEHLDLYENVDMLLVGTRNMQNFELLKALGKTNKPILLKRGFSNTLKEMLMSAEYIMAEGNENVVLCESGIRSYDNYTKNVLDLSAVPMLHELTHLPVVVDPSRATGIARLVPTMSLAAVSAGADGLMIEVHNDPKKALCDGAQSLTPKQYEELFERVVKLQTALK